MASALGRAPCRRGLTVVDLTECVLVGAAAVKALVRGCRRLNTLNLTGCVKVCVCVGGGGLWPHGDGLLLLVPFVHCATRYFLLRRETPHRQA